MWLSKRADTNKTRYKHTLNSRLIVCLSLVIIFLSKIQAKLIMKGSNK